MAEANLIPGATQVFADVLEGGSVKKLFANMQKGKYDLQDIVKVLDSLESKLKKDLLTKMFDKPSVAMNDFRTALTRFWEEVNSSGGTDLLIGGLTGIADALKGATKWMKENKEEIALWTNRVKHLVGALWDLKEVLLALYVTNKLIAASGVATGLWSFLTRIPVLPPAPLSVRIINMLKSGLRMAARAWPVLAGAFIWDLIETLQGKTTMLSTWASSNNPFVAFVAKIPILLGEAISNLMIGGFLLYDWIKASLFGDSQDVSTVQEAASMWASDMIATLDKYGMRPAFEFFQESIRRISYLSAALRDAMTGNMSGMNMNLGMFTASIKTYGFNTNTHQAALAEMRREEAAPQNMAILQNRPAGIPWAQGYKPAQQGMSQQTINLTINAEGTPDAIKSVATQAFADMMSSSILGVSANYQGGK